MCKLIRGRAGTINSDNELSGKVAKERGNHMAKRPRSNHEAAFKAKVALEAIRGEKTLVKLSE